MSIIIKSNFVNPIAEDRVDMLNAGYLCVDDSGRITALMQLPVISSQAKKPILLLLIQKR